MSYLRIQTSSPVTSDLWKGQITYSNSGSFCRSWSSLKSTLHSISWPEFVIANIWSSFMFVARQIILSSLPRGVSCVELVEFKVLIWIENEPTMRNGVLSSSSVTMSIKLSSVAITKPESWLKQVAIDFGTGEPKKYDLYSPLWLQISISPSFVQTRRSPVLAHEWQVYRSESCRPSSRLLIYVWTKLKTDSFSSFVAIFK